VVGLAKRLGRRVPGPLARPITRLEPIPLRSSEKPIFTCAERDGSAAAPFCKEEMKREGDKLSGCVIAMAETVLVRPSDQVSDEAAHAALLLASVAWNREVDSRRPGAAKEYLAILMEFERHNSSLRTELKSPDCEALIAEMQKFKRSRYPNDHRFILTCGIKRNGNVQVMWEEGE
jgi:hypothetical protein